MVYVLGQAALPVVLAAISSKVLVALGGLVVVVAILLVFAMVLRSNGNSKKSAGGLGYDEMQGPLGQPRGPLSQPGAGRPYGTQGPPQQWGNEPDYGQAPVGVMTGGYGAGGWGAANGNYESASGGYNEMPSGGYGQMGGNPGGMGGYAEMGDGPGGMGGGAVAGQGRWAPNNAPAPNRWNPEPAPMSQGGMGQAGMGQAGMGQGGAMPQQAWDAPAAGGWQDQGNYGQQQAWGAPNSPSQQAQQAWNPPTPGWAAPPSQQPGWQGQPSGAMQGGMPGGMPGAPASNPGQWGAPPATAGYPDPMQQPMRNPNPYAAANRTAALVVRQGKDVGRTYDVRRDRTTIGRSRDSDIFLEDLAVSRLHTTVNRDENGRYILRDENSANGTFVNSQRVTEHPLQEGDEIQVGQTVMTFQQR